MKLYKTLMVLVLCAIALTGCNSSGGITKKDLGIVKVDNKDDLVQYGMSRSDSEKVLGKGEAKGKNGVSYENGITVIYRNEKVVAIRLGEGSEGVYTTTNGAKIGMLEDQIKEIYGEIAVESSPKGYLSYYYDTGDKTFLNREEADGLSGKIKPPETEKMHIVTLKFDANGYSENIVLSDGTYVFFFY